MPTRIRTTRLFTCTIAACRACTATRMAWYAGAARSFERRNETVGAASASA